MAKKKTGSPIVRAVKKMMPGEVIAKKLGKRNKWKGDRSFTEDDRKAKPKSYKKR